MQKDDKETRMVFDKIGIKVDNLDNQTLRKISDFFYCKIHSKEIGEKYCKRFNSNEKEIKINLFQKLRLKNIKKQIF